MLSTLDSTKSSHLPHILQWLGGRTAIHENLFAPRNAMICLKDMKESETIEHITLHRLNGKLTFNVDKSAKKSFDLSTVRHLHRFPDDPEYFVVEFIEANGPTRLEVFKIGRPELIPDVENFIIRHEIITGNPIEVSIAKPIRIEESDDEEVTHRKVDEDHLITYAPTGKYNYDDSAPDEEINSKVNTNSESAESESCKNKDVIDTQYQPTLGNLNENTDSVPSESTVNSSSAKISVKQNNNLISNNISDRESSDSTFSFLVKDIEESKTSSSDRNFPKASIRIVRESTLNYSSDETIINEEKKSIIDDNEKTNNKHASVKKILKGDHLRSKSDKLFANHEHICEILCLADSEKSQFLEKERIIIVSDKKKESKTNDEQCEDIKIPVLHTCLVCPKHGTIPDNKKGETIKVPVHQTRFLCMKPCPKQGETIKVPVHQTRFLCMKPCPKHTIDEAKVSKRRHNEHNANHCTHRDYIKLERCERISDKQMQNQQQIFVIREIPKSK